MAIAEGYMTSGVHVFLKIEMQQLRDEAVSQKEEAEVSASARYQESMINILDQLDQHVRGGQFCDKDHWIAIEKRITEAAQRDACCGQADISGIVKMLSVETDATSSVREPDMRPAMA